ncbi:BrnT family toxin [Candidatus Saccharibacteria bacterium]|nr:BrnT family toxin [Candidatus Saccharibacteria bacterium]MBR3414941.1 BrnT family toxin [Candidatus Saccharibacteria bacterium]
MKIKVDGLSIEWDAQKNSLNIKKHHINFKDAALIFFDENRVEIYDSLHSDTEDRYITIGMVDEILFVVYTERLDSLRIISARIATPSEKEIYYGKNS